MWADFLNLDAGQRSALVKQLKQRIDQLVRSDPPRALEVSDALDRAARATPGTQAVAARGRAMAKHANGRAAEALSDYLEAARLHAAEGDELELGRVHRSLVDVYQMSGQTKEALQSADTARHIFERLGARGLLAQLEANMGNVFVRLDDYPAARRHYVAACRLFEEQGDELAMAVTRYNLAVTETSANAIFEARQSFLDSARVFAERGMHVHTADCEYMLAYLEARRGRFASAIGDLEKARGLYAECGKPSGGPLCDLDLAEIYYRIDACRDSLEHAARAQAAFAQLGMDYERAKSALFASLARARLGQRELALDEMEVARGTLVRLGNRAWPAVLEIHRCAIELASRPGSAVPTEGSVQQLRDARSALREQGLRLWDSLASVALARLHLARGETGAAHEELRQVERAWSEHEELDALVKMEQRVVLADVRLAEGDSPGAIEALRNAVETIENTWSNVPGTDVRTAFFRTRHDAFAHLALLLSDQPDTAEEAFETLELGRLRSLRDTPTWSRPAADLLRARERLDWLLARQLDAQLGPAAGVRDGAGAPVTDEELLEAQLEVVRRSRSDDLPLARAGSRDPVAPRLRARLAADELLVTWVMTDRGSRVLLLDRNGVRARDLELDVTTVRELADRLFFQLHKFELGEAYRERHRERMLASTNAVLDELGERVLAPLRAALEDKQRLVFVPYGALHGLPMHAFRLSGRPLIATHDVSYALSGYQLLAAQAEEPSRQGTGEDAADRVTIVSSDTASLPAIAREVEAIRGRYPDQARSLAPEGLRDALEGDASAGGLLHVSAHGAFQPGHPVFSGLRLGEGVLTAHDLAPLRLPYQIVSLSGCETGRLGHTDGEEVFGLNRAFLGAGARSVVSSLWPVADGDCAALMARFYRHLSQGAEVRHALCAAQRERIREDPHPFAWASFTTCGDPAARLPALVRAPRASAPPLKHP